MPFSMNIKNIVDILQQKINRILLNLMKGQEYSQYVEMGKNRVKYVQNQTQGQPKPCDFIKTNFSQEQFITLYGSQDKKAIKLMTYRQKNRTQQPKGVVFLFHSFCMHTGLTAHLAQRLAKQGFIAVGLDQRGHGKSQGEKGFLDQAKEILKDSANFIKNTIQLYPKLPYFYFGHGVGASICLNLIKEKKQFKPKGIIIGSPSLKKPQSSKVVSAISDFALKIMPNRAGLFALDFNNLTRNPIASSILTKDPLIYHEKVFVKTLVQMQQMLDVIDEKYWSKMQLPPIVIIQGELDRGSDAINSIKFYQSLPIKQKELWYYRKMWHMFLYEEQYPEIQNRIVEWLNKQLK